MAMTTRRIQQKGYPAYRPRHRATTVHGAARPRSSASFPAPGRAAPCHAAAAGSNFPRTALRGAGGQGLVTHGPLPACLPARHAAARQEDGGAGAWLCLRLHTYKGVGVGPRANFKPENIHGWLA